MHRALHTNHRLDVTRIEALHAYSEGSYESAEDETVDDPQNKQTLERQKQDPYWSKQSRVTTEEEEKKTLHRDHRNLASICPTISCEI